MYRITIRTKSGSVPVFWANDVVFSSFKSWLIGGVGAAEADLNRRPCDVFFFFEEGAIHRDNIDVVSWEQQAPRTGVQTQRSFEMLDEGPAAQA